MLAQPDSSFLFSCEGPPIGAQDPLPSLLNAGGCLQKVLGVGTISEAHWPMSGHLTQSSQSASAVPSGFFFSGGGAPRSAACTADNAFSPDVQDEREVVDLARSSPPQRVQVGRVLGKRAQLGEAVGKGCKDPQNQDGGAGAIAQPGRLLPCQQTLWVPSLASQMIS